MKELTKVTEVDRNTTVYPMGMREMQHNVFEKRTSQYLLIKAPPASGKSRALMYTALDKLNNQGIKKVIVSVPERSIGGSFKSTDLASSGFMYNWDIEDKYNLCTGNSSGKSGRLMEFLLDDNKSKLLVCTHSALRNVVEDIDLRDFNDCLIAIDEFHHVSVSDSSRLGNAINKIIENSNAHVIAMTGSYIRGDGVAILTAENEAKFDVVTYSYYDQLRSYKYLESISFDYEFYTGRYIDAVDRHIDLTKKTIVYIPNVNSLAAEYGKEEAVDRIYDVIGKEIYDDKENCIKHFKTKLGTVVKVANFVNDDQKDRDRYLKYASDLSNRDAIDIIITLNLAKEGFDWPWCEELIVINYRDSITETVQIIGRVSRDCPGKQTGKFVYLIPRPNIADSNLDNAVNDMLKVNTLILLMEQVMTPTIHFTTNKFKAESELSRGKTVIFVDPDNAVGATEKALSIINQHQDTLIMDLVKECPSAKGCIVNDDNAEVLVEIEVPSMIKKRFSELDNEEIEFVSKSVLTAMYVKKQGLVNREDIPEGTIIEGEIDFKIKGEAKAKFLAINEKYINIDDLDLDLIKDINPLKSDYEVISKKMDIGLLNKVKGIIKARKVEFTREELNLSYVKILKFKEERGRLPKIDSADPYEQRLALAFVKLQELKASLKSNR